MSDESNLFICLREIAPLLVPLWHHTVIQIHGKQQCEDERYQEGLDGGQKLF